MITFEVKKTCSYEIESNDNYFIGGKDGNLLEL